MMKFVILIATVLLVSSCAKDLGTLEGREFFEVQVGQGTVTFKALKNQLLDGKCLRCHSWANDESEILSRVVPGDPAASPLYDSVKDGWMPKGGPELTSNEKLLVARYIEDLKASETDDLSTKVPSQTIPSDPTFVSFTEMSEVFFANKCTNCHKGMKTEEGILEYIVPGDAEASPLYLSVKDDWMPKRGPVLTEEEKEVMRVYIDGLEPLAPAVSFLSMKESFFDQKCAKCHKGMGTEEGLQEYIIPGNGLESPLFKSVENDWMPKRGPKLTSAEKQMLLDYIDGL